ncbi:MAG: sulfite exporter TauE/SafE family protein [Sphingomonadales bacterium]|nr:sulfite exporter TauE/SafE family protein [Sphingomonadales bacterium]
MTWMSWLLLPIVGAAGGFMAGMLGVGGGIIFIPLLTWLFGTLGLPQEEIVRYTLANSILLVVVSGLTGTWKQYRLGEWQWRKVLSIGLPGAVVSYAITYAIQHGDWYSKPRFNLVFLFFLAISLANMIFGKKQDSENQTAKENPILAVFVGVLAGAVVALSGLGGGVIMVPLFRMLLKMPMRQATALSLSIIPILGIAPLSGYLLAHNATILPFLHTGYIAWPYALPMAAGVAVFATRGMKAAKRISETTLRIIFAILSSIVIVKTLYDIFS